jgi:hypothetical protein
LLDFKLSSPVLLFEVMNDMFVNRLLIIVGVQETVLSAFLPKAVLDIPRPGIRHLKPLLEICDLF